MEPLDGLRALTVKQPHAWAIFHAGKDIENKNWVTDYRGPVLIHAAGTIVQYPELPNGVRRPKDEELILSAIIGVADLVDIPMKSRSRWSTGEPWHRCWVLRNPRRLDRPVPCRGRTGLWHPSPAVMREVEAQLLDRSA